MLTRLQDRIARRRILSLVFSLIIAAGAVIGVAGAGGVASAAQAAAGAHVAVAHPHGGGTGGYWLSASDGGIFSYGDATFDGSTGGDPLNAPIVGMAATPSGGGYWEVASDGGIFSFGNAGFFGSTGGMPLNKPIVGMAATPDGGGYWLVASDGGIFAFGDAGFFGSTGGMPLNAPIVGMAATANGQGYYLVASDGGLFAYGNAVFDGSMGGQSLNKPIVGMAATPDGAGYWLVASDGGIFAFGTADFFGSTGGTTLNKPIVGMADTADGLGYYLVASDGGIFAYGDATFYGSTGGMPLNEPIVGMAVVPTQGTLIDPGHTLVGISCPSATWCMAVDNVGNAINYNNGTWSAPQFVDTPENPAEDSEFDGISCPTTTWCMAVSYLTGYVIYDNGTWQAPRFPVNYPNTDFSGVSCTSSSFCGISSVHGYSYAYNSGVFTSTGATLSGSQGSTPISCQPGTGGQGFCMQGDNATAYSYTIDSGASWTAAASVDPGADAAGAFLVSNSCTSDTYCKAIIQEGGYAETWNGSGWSRDGNIDAATTFDDLEGLSCVSGTQVCATVDFAGNVLYGSGASWTAPIAFDTTGVPNAISCGSTTSCMAVDTSGYAYKLTSAPPA